MHYSICVMVLQKETTARALFIKTDRSDDKFKISVENNGHS